MTSQTTVKVSQKRHSVSCLVHKLKQELLERTNPNSFVTLFKKKLNSLRKYDIG
jgi:hypothetical protein